MSPHQITLNHLAESRPAPRRFQSLPDMLSALDMACYPYFQAALKGAAMRLVLFRLSMFVGDEDTPKEILEQQRPYCADVQPDMQLLAYDASRNSLAYGYDSAEEAIAELIHDGEATHADDFVLLRVRYVLEIIDPMS